jgi:hypothetical protein
MRKFWMVVALVGLVPLACKREGGAPPIGSSSPTAVVAPSVGSAPTPTVAAGDQGCRAPSAYLVPPQKYPDGDLIRAVLVDADRVFFRNMNDLMSVPLAGGPVVTLGKAPALSLRGTTELWQAGDELVMQSPGEPIFMKAKKSGGTWSSFIDLTAAKKGGGRDAATRILQGLGKPASAAASAADFDGKAFYYAEITKGKASNAPASSTLKSVAFSGGTSQTLFETPGEVSEVTRVGDQIAFHLVLPPSAEQIKAKEEERKKNKFAFGVSGESWLMSVPIAGGAAKRLMRLSSLFNGGLIQTGTILGADGARLYASGYVDGDLQKPGVFRIDVASGESVQLDKRFIHGKAYISSNEVLLVGRATVEPGKARGTLLLTVPRDGKNVTLASCIADTWSLHASALAPQALLLSLFEGSTGMASIAKLPLH